MQLLFGMPANFNLNKKNPPIRACLNFSEEFNTASLYFCYGNAELHGESLWKVIANEPDSTVPSSGRTEFGKYTPNGLILLMMSPDYCGGEQWAKLEISC